MQWRMMSSRAAAPPSLLRRGNREKELFALRAQHVKTLFRSLEMLAAAVNKEAGAPLLVPGLARQALAGARMP